MTFDKTNMENTIVVNEGEYAMSYDSDLYTTDLYSCVALYAITKDFNFLAHILVEDRSSEFMLTGVDKVNKLYDCLSEIDNYEEEIYVGLVYGIWDDPSLSADYNEIASELEDKITMLQEEGFNIEMLADAQSEFVFMNFKEKEIVLENESINLEGSWDYNKVRRL